MSSTTKIFFLFLMGIGLTSCGHFRADSRSTPKSGEMSVHITAQYKKTESIITRIYVYPPLKTTEAGVPVEALFHTVDSNGNLVWHAPSSEAVELQGLLESCLTARGFRVVPFPEILDPQNGHAILVFNAYYSDEFRRMTPEKDSENDVRFVSVRISASTFPKDLDVQKKKDIINVHVLAQYSSVDPWFSCVKTSLKQAVKHVGENGKGIKSCLIFP